jgi:hypothetical protein
MGLGLSLGIGSGLCFLDCLALLCLALSCLVFYPSDCLVLVMVDWRLVVGSRELALHCMSLNGAQQRLADSCSLLLVPLSGSQV